MKMTTAILMSLTIGSIPQTLANFSPLEQLTNLSATISPHDSRSLEDIRTKELLGLDFENPSDRDRIIDQAREYQKFYRHGNFMKRKKFLETCDPSSNPFCHFEIAFQPNAETLKISAPTPSLPLMSSEASTSNSGEHGTRQIIELVDSTDIKTVLKQMGRFKSLADYSAFLKTVLSTQKCLSPSLYTALALKGEEFFPSEQIFTEVSSIYQLSMRCGSDSASMHARFRLALLKLWKNDCREIEDLLAPILQDPGSSSFHLRSLFWRHHCAVKMGRQTLASQVRQTLRNEFPLSFHNLYLTELYDRRSVRTEQSERQVFANFRSLKKPELNSPTQATEGLIFLKDFASAKYILETLTSQSGGAELGYRLYLATLLNRVQSGLVNFGLLAQIFKEDSSLVSVSSLKLFFPLWHQSTIEGVKSVDPYLIFSLVRQESAFNERARSSAGAVGLMQVMPQTARSILRLPRGKLFHPATNVKVGTIYFSRRLKQYSGDVELTLAAYNAGSGRVEEWLRRYPVSDRLLFIDLIPFRETREYVTSILRNYFWYVLLYSRESLPSRLEANYRRPGSQTIFHTFESLSKEETGSGI